MNKDFTRKMKSLIELYLEKKAKGEEIYAGYVKLMEDYRQWQRKNILDYQKLTSYSDEEFAEVFKEMFEHSDGSAKAHNLSRFRFTKKESRIAARGDFEEMVKRIIEVGDGEERFGLFAEVVDKVAGMGRHMMTTLINAQYPDVPVINGVTEKFFRDAGLDFSSKPAEQQEQVRKFFDEMVALGEGEMSYDDVNLMIWFAETDEVGRSLMGMCFPETFEKKVK